MDNKVSTLINDQVSKEFYSGYLYLSFADFFDDLGLDGFAHWYEVQAQEERDHAMLMRTFLHNNGEKVTLGAIDKPDKTLEKPMDALEAAFGHEQYITGTINTIYKAAKEADDFRTMQFLDWFVKEQGEEEKNAEDLIKKFKLFGSDAKGLYALNQELLGRVYNAPSLVI